MTFEQWLEEQLQDEAGQRLFSTGRDAARIAWEAGWKDGNKAGYKDGQNDGQDYSYGGTHRHPLDMD